jgi:hypothetical protein
MRKASNPSLAKLNPKASAGQSANPVAVTTLNVNTATNLNKTATPSLTILRHSRFTSFP